MGDSGTQQGPGFWAGRGARRTSWRVLLQVTVPALGSILVYALAFYAFFLPAFRDSLMDQKRILIREEVQIAWTVAASMHERELDGTMTREAAQAEAMALLHDMRFGPDGLDYFWINDLRVVMLMHPYRPDLVGQDVSFMPDAAGNLLFQDFLRVATTEGEGFVDYVWQYQDDIEREVPKLSYVKLFEPWGWIIGHGVYIEDVKEETRRVSARVIRVSGMIAVVIFLLGAWLASITLRAEQERAEARREADATRRRLADIIDLLPEATIVVDSDHRVIVWNRAMAEMTSIPAEEMLGKSRAHYSAPFYGVDRPLLLDLILDPEHTSEDHWENLQRDGDLISNEAHSPAMDRYHVATAGPLRDPNGEIVGAIETIMDVTRRHRAEASRNQLQQQLFRAQRLESIGKVAGGIAHDFNNLLSPILGYSELLLADATRRGDEKSERMSRLVNEAADRARDLTAQLLAFSRQQPMRVATISLNHVIRGFEGILEGAVREDVSLQIRLGSKLAPIRGDQGQIEQIVMNLVMNAQDAMPEGGMLSIETSNVVLDASQAAMDPDARPGPHALLTVSDTGVGIEPDVVGRIFEPFFTTKDQERGSGLGLSMVLGAVQQHDGHLVVYSEPGIGTTIRLYFPAVDHEITRDVLDEGEGVVLGGTETVLVVEDDARVRQLVEDVLARHGYTVLATDDPDRAANLVREHADTLALLVSDVVMPSMNGPELHRSLTRIRPDLPVLFMSGYTGDVISHHGILEGDVRIVPKPFRIDELLMKVREVLDEA